MKAVRIHDYGTAQQLVVEDAPEPQAADGQLIIETVAAGVNPVDWKIREGYMRWAFDPPMPLILGTEISGIVRTIGAGVTGFAVGDPVIAFTGIFGGYAEYAAVDAANVVHKPSNLSFERAASVPMSIQTAWGAIVDAARIQAGDRLLILGAAGAVGSAAVQIARMLGAEVYGTCSLRSADRLRALGAHPIPYDAPAPSLYPEVDVIVDMVGSDAVAPALPGLRSTGRYVTLLTPADVEPVAARGYEASFFAISPDPERLRTVTRKLEEGTITMADPVIFPFDQVVEAHALSEGGHPASRIILKPAI